MRKPSTHRHLAQKKGMQRWCQRKEDELRAGLERQAQDELEFGGWYRLFFAQCHLSKVKKELFKAERQMLETTSLKDLIH